MSTNPGILPYRRGVGIVLFNAVGQVFVGERIETPGAWQMPQGGIEPGEDLETAFFRELLEETGTDKAIILEVMSETLRYDFPTHAQTKLYAGKYRGQEQTWIAARFTGNDSDINIFATRHMEFQAWKWLKPDELLKIIVPFKRKTYETVLNRFSRHSKQDHPPPPQAP